MPGSPVEYVHAVDVAGFADRSIAAGTLQPFIAVVPAAGDAPTSLSLDVLVSLLAGTTGYVDDVSLKVS